MSFTYTKWSIVVHLLISHQDKDALMERPRPVVGQFLTANTLQMERQMMDLVKHRVIPVDVEILPNVSPVVVQMRKIIAIYATMPFAPAAQPILSAVHARQIQ